MIDSVQKLGTGKDVRESPEDKRHMVRHDLP